MLSFFSHFRAAIPIRIRVKSPGMGRTLISSLVFVQRRRFRPGSGGRCNRRQCKPKEGRRGGAALIIGKVVCFALNKRGREASDPPASVLQTCHSLRSPLGRFNFRFHLFALHSIGVAALCFGLLFPNGHFFTKCKLYRDGSFFWSSPSLRSSLVPRARSPVSL